MKSTVRIENVGPIKFAEIDLQKYIVLIGEQATGKSTIAKVVYSLTNVAEVINNNLKHYMILRNIVKTSLVLGNIYYDIYDIMKKIENFDSGSIFLLKDSRELISYTHNSDLKFSKEFEDSVISVIDRLQTAIDLLTDENNNISQNAQLELGSICENLVEENIKSKFFNSVTPFFVPLNDINTYKHLSLKFSDNNNKNDSTWEIINSLSKSVLRGNFNRRKNNEQLAFVELTNEHKKVAIDSLSSGQKYSLIIFNHIKHYSISNTFYRFIIEEPETHLFPAAQSDVTKAIITFANQPEKENQVLITTHSPYVLSTINNLLYAGQLAEDKRTDLEKLKSVVPEHLWMKPSDFACYKVKDGVLEDLVVTLDSSIKQIDQEYIDRISNVLIDEMNQLILIDPNDE